MTDRIFDGEWQLFQYDPETGIQTWVIDDGKKMTVRKVFPVDDLMDLNAMQRSLNAGTRHRDGMSQIASVPLPIYYRDLAEPLRESDEKWIKRWLNDPDNRKFRTREGDV